MLSWYALHTKPHKERQVESVLTERGIQVYFPTIPAPPRRGRSPERAFFPCYLFAYTDLESVGLWTLHYAPGVRGVVMFGGIPARVGDDLIVALRARLADVKVVDERGEVLKPGDRVVITSGPFADVEALFDRKLSAAGRVRVLIKMLQHSAAVELDANVLRKAR